VASGDAADPSPLSINQPTSIDHRAVRPPFHHPVVNSFDYVFAENGLIAFKLGKPLQSASFIGYVGEEEYKKLANFILRYLSEVDIPIKR
jgi:hypothetical protein